MERICAHDGVAFEAVKDARFCSSRCRTAARRLRAAGKPESVTPVVEPERVEGPLVKACRAELVAAGREETLLGQQALSLADRLDGSRDSVTAAAAAHRELRAMMTEVLSGSKAAGDGVDELRGRRENRFSA